MGACRYRDEAEKASTYLKDSPRVVRGTDRNLFPVRFSAGGGVSLGGMLGLGLVIGLLCFFVRAKSAKQVTTSSLCQQ